jgi:hypothetical protein
MKNIIILVLSLLLLASWISNDTIIWQGKKYYKHNSPIEIVNDTIDDGGFLIITKGTRIYYDHFPCTWKKTK